VALVIVAMLPRVGKRRREEVVVERDGAGRFDRDGRRVTEPAETTTTHRRA
jgi:hypothetical protein